MAPLARRLGMVSLRFTCADPIDSELGFWGIKAFDVNLALDELAKAGPVDHIKLLVDSPGGLVSEALTLYTELFARMLDGTKLTAEARGTVASAATMPFVLATERVMISDSSRVMVHAPWVASYVMGNLKDIEQQSEELKTALAAATQILKSTMTASGIPAASVDAWMDGDNWFVGQEAVDARLATSMKDMSDMPNSKSEAATRASAESIAEPEGEQNVPVPDAARIAMAEAIIRNLRSNHNAA